MLGIEVAARDEHRARRQGFAQRGLESVDRGALRLVIDGGARVAVAALVDALLVMAVRRSGDAEVIEPAGAHPLVARVEQIEREIPQIGDEIAVAAEELIVSRPAMSGGGA